MKIFSLLNSLIESTHQYIPIS
jgi:hypothetical protein